MNKLKYTHYDVVFQEVPNEVSLAINISGCPYKCEGCHSKYLWEYVGNILSDDFDSILDRYKDSITCVCFMGGDQNAEELEDLLSHTHSKYNLKTCLYSGTKDIKNVSNLIPFLDFVKIGPYIEEFGGLSDPNTNQRFYEVKKTHLRDATQTFQTKKGRVL